MKVVISFDDALVGDIKAAKLLTKYGFKGTFYVPSGAAGRHTPMSLKEIREQIVLKGHEIGGHTVNHPQDMKLLSDEDLEYQVKNNKMLIELLLVKGEITKFCYPRGRHDQRVRDAIKKAGYTEARTTQVFQIRNETGDPFQTPTTIHMFPRSEYNGEDWLSLAKDYFNVALGDGEFFSLWGHTNELDQYHYWGKFEEMLQFMQAALSPVSVGANGAKVYN
jgi:peptidoglycan/xylan/chitin deacetylase (PgdA/CDA1 family)